MTMTIPVNVVTCSGCGMMPPDHVVGECECGSGEWRRGDWIQTYSGRMFWPFDPRVDDMVIEDIAISLSRKCRFGGHCKEFYCVADHSIWVMERLSPDLQLAGLLHDAAEAYLVDMPRPVKHSPEMALYRQIEDRIQSVIFAWAGVLDVAMENELFLKAVDALALATEKRDLIVEGHGRWKGVEKIEPHPDTIEPTVSMRQSADAFIEHFERLFEETHGTNAGHLSR